MNISLDFVFSGPQPDVEVGTFPSMYPGEFPETRILLQPVARKIA